MLTTLQLHSDFNIPGLIPDAFISLDANECFTYACRTAGEMFQRRPEDLIGKQFLTEFAEVLSQSFHTAYKKAVKEQQYVSAEEYSSVHDRWFENHIYPSPAGISIFFRDVTQRKREEELLKSSETRLRAFFENCMDAMLLGYPDGTVFSANRAACSLFGRTEEEICLSGRDVLMDHSDPGLNACLREMEQTGKVECEVSMLKKDGSKFPAGLRSDTFTDANGQKYICVIIRDITNRKQEKEQSSVSEQTYLRILDNISEAIYIQDANGIFLDVNLAAEKMYGYTRKEIIGQPPEFLSAPGKNNFHTIKACIKKAFNGEPQLFEFWGRRKDGTIFPKDVSISAGNYFGKKVIIALGRDITERKEAQEALRESDETFRRLFYESADAILLLDDTGFADCNQSAVSVLGYSSKEKIINKKPWDLSPKKQPDGMLSTEKAELMIAKALKQGYNRFEWVHTKADGTEFPVEVMLTSIILKGKQSFFTIWRDITERKKAEKEVTDYKFALDQSSIVDVSDSSGIIRFANENFCKISGYSKEELKGQDHRILSSGYHSKEFIKNLWDTVLKGKVWRGEVRNKAKDGSFYWVDTTVVPFLNEEGNPFQFITIRTDITKRKNAEASIMEALERYDLLSKATSDTIWDWDIKNDVIFYNAGITKIFGYKSNRIQNTENWWEMNVYPEDREQVMDKLGKAFFKKKQTVQFEYRFRCSNGTYKYVLDRAFIIYDEGGSPLRVIGSMQNISDEKEFEIRMEKAVIDAQEREVMQIGMELHDNVNQILAASLLYLGLAQVSIEKKQNNTSDIIHKSEQYIGDAISEVRRLSHQLAPVAVKDDSLERSFESLIETINVNRKFKIRLQVSPIEKNLIPDELQINLYRILQEQLNNIVKYAHASEVIINVTIEESRLKLQIADNGKGFNPRIQSKGIGLENIKRRVKVFYGEFKLKTAPGKGCEIIVEVPLKALS